MKILNILFVILFPFLGLAGDWSSSGGNAVACLNENGSIVSAELLDLYEGRVLEGKEKVHYSVDTSKSYLEIAKIIAAKLDRIMETQNFFEKIVEDINKEIIFLPKNVELLPISDSNHFITPKGCKVYQLANFRSNNKIYVDSNLWTALDKVNKAALLVHEGLYYYLRTIFGERSSFRTRRAVANLFAGTRFTPTTHVESSVKEWEICETLDQEHSLMPFAKFLTYKNSDGHLIFQFWALNGTPMIGKSFFFGHPSNWPLSETVSDTTMLQYLNSIVDDGLGYRIHLDNNPNDAIHGFIASASNMPHLELHPFSCELRRRS